MAIRSIFEYVADKCYNGLFEAAKSYLHQNWRNMELYSRRVPNIEKVGLVDATVQRVYVTDLPDDRIAFDVGFELEIYVSTEERYSESDTCYQWLRFSCEGDLACGLDDWRITNVQVYSKQKMPENSMSDALVPNIRYDQMETVADDFLKQYYPEALQIPRAGEAPTYIDPVVLAERLGLTIKTQRIKEDASVFGQLFFADTDTEMYDATQGKTVPVRVDAQTIVVDPQMFLLRNLGSVNNTIVHECVHWTKHRKVFLLEKLYNEQAASISCQVVGGASSEMSRHATEKMEKQANQLTPRIQMPMTPFKARATYLTAKYMRDTNARHEIEVMEAVIEQLALDFGVSKQAAKIRLVEVGIESAVGTFTYVDNHYVPPHSYKTGAIGRNQTFTLGAQDAAIQRLVNPALHSLTAEGDYLFVENHFVFNAPLYVEKDTEGHIQLTNYARSHMDECCLVFDMKIRGTVREEYHTVCYLNREPGGYTFDITFHDQFQNAPKSEQIALRKAERDEELNIRRQMTDDPEQCMKLLMDWRNTDYTELGATIERDPKTLSRNVNGKTNPTLDTAVRICFGLNLPPSISAKLLGTFGITLNPLDSKHQWILEALHTQYPAPIEDALQYLADYGVTI